MDRDLNGAIDWAEWERFHRPLSVYFDDDEAYEDYVRSLWSLPPHVPRQHAGRHGVPIDDNPESNIPAHMRPPFQPERVPRQSFTAQLRQGKTDVDVWNDGPAAVVGGAWMGGNESKAPPTQEGTLRARYPGDHLGRREAVVVGTTIPTVMKPGTLAEPAPGADEQWRTLRRLLFDPPCSLAELLSRLGASGGAMQQARPRLPRTAVGHGLRAIDRTLDRKETKALVETAADVQVDARGPFVDVLALHLALVQRYGEPLRSVSSLEKVQRRALRAVVDTAPGALARIEAECDRAADDRGGVSKDALGVAVGAALTSLALTQCELDLVFRKLDVRRTEAVAAGAFGMWVRSGAPPLSEGRAAAVDAAWRRIVDCAGAPEGRDVPRDRFEATYPECAWWTADEGVAARMCDGMCGAAPGGAGATAQSFLGYCRLVSGLVAGDEYFGAWCERSFPI